MRHFILILSISVFLLSCNQNDKKELELKERELALKEKEFALKQGDTTKLNLQPSITKDNPTISQVNSTPSATPVVESAVIKEIVTSKGKYPVIQLSDKTKENEINSFIFKKLFGKAYNPPSIKSIIESQGGQDYSYEIFYKIISNTSSKLKLTLSSCITGANTLCESYEFNINPTTGSKSVKTVQ